MGRPKTPAAPPPGMEPKQTGKLHVVGRQHRVVIHSEICGQLDLEPGDLVTFRVVGDELCVRRARLVPDERDGR